MSVCFTDKECVPFSWLATYLKIGTLFGQAYLFIMYQKLRELERYKARSAESSSKNSVSARASLWG